MAASNVALLVTTREQNERFESWLREHPAVLHHVANGFATGADRHDLMQELLLALWRSVTAFRGGAQTSTFVYRVAHNAALTWPRTQRNYAARIERFEGLAAMEWPAGSAGSEAREREALEALLAAYR